MMLDPRFGAYNCAMDGPGQLLRVSFLRIMLYAQRQALNRPLFQHATRTIVVLDIAGLWATEAYGLCRLCAYFCAQGHTALSFCRSLPQACYMLFVIYCAHKLISTLFEGDGERKITLCYFPNRDGDGAFATNKNELAAPSKGCRCWCWCCGPGRWCCELAERV